MFEVWFLWALGIVWILFAVVEDIRKREIANWLNYSLAIFAIGFRFFYSLFELDSFSFFYQGLVGLGIFILVGNLFYYGKMFAGGDAKLFMSVGAILPIFDTLSLNLRIFFVFVLFFLISGAVYGLIASVYFGLKNFKKLKKEFMEQRSINSGMVSVALWFSALLFIFSFLLNELFYFGVFLFALPYFYLYVKSVDEACMVKRIDTSKLTEGDWLYSDIKLKKKKICATWDGISLEEIDLLRKERKKVWIRTGIAFAPVFLISFVLMICFIELGFFPF